MAQRCVRLQRAVAVGRKEERMLGVLWFLLTLRQPGGRSARVAQLGRRGKEAGAATGGAKAERALDKAKKLVAQYRKE